MARTYVERIIREKKLAQVDAPKPITIVVTQNDIVNAKSRHSKCCAFALAAKRKPGVHDAFFFLTTAYLEYKDQMVRYKLPPSVQKEIISFDRAKIVAPGAYQLAPPPHSMAPTVTKAKRQAVKRNAKRAERAQHQVRPVRQVERQRKIAETPMVAADVMPGHPTKPAAPAKPRIKTHKTAYVRSMQEPLW